MSECENCGRQDGHHLGCAEARLAKPEPEHPIAADHGPVPAECSFEGCEEERWSIAPAAKFCENHRDPKNRK